MSHVFGAGMIDNASFAAAAVANIHIAINTGSNFHRNLTHVNLNKNFMNIPCIYSP
jgi:hypothetical protein